MRRLIHLVILIFLMSVFSMAQQSTSDFPKLTGPNLGQKPPGMTAELFAPGIVSTGNFEHSSPVFSPDLTEIYWSTIIEESGKVVLRPTYFMKMVNGIWTKPQIPSFGKKFLCCENPFISPDGERLFFAADNTIPINNFNLYYVNKVGNGWSEPIKMNKSINRPNYHACLPTVSKKGTLYFYSYQEQAETGFGLYYSELVNGEYQKPVFMEKKFNSLQVDWTPYIAPDESYLIFCSFRDGGFGSGDLYICFKERDGSWGKIINMGDKINTDLNERFPNVTPDGKYLFFNSTRKIQGADTNGPGNGNGDIYWIDAKIIEELRPKK